MTFCQFLNDFLSEVEKHKCLLLKVILHCCHCKESAIDNKTTPKVLSSCLVNAFSVTSWLGICTRGGAGEIAVLWYVVL